MGSTRTLTLRREGLFTVKTVPGTPHCGITERVRIRYEFCAVCSPNLDDRGFLFDQLTIDRFFRKKRECRSSCEKVAARSLRELLKIIKKENPRIQILEARLKLVPEPFQASITVDWRRAA